MMARFPQYTTCRYCKGVLRRNHGGDPWTVYGPAGTTYTECPDAPNPEDGPMPPHEPGTKILEPPIESNELNESPPVVIPVIPRMSTAAGSDGQTRRRVYHSAPFGHRLTIVKEGLKVTRTLDWPDQRDREPRVQVYDALSNWQAEGLYSAWTKGVPSGYRLIESTERDESEVPR